MVGMKACMFDGRGVGDCDRWGKKTEIERDPMDAGMGSVVGRSFDLNGRETGCPYE